MTFQISALYIGLNALLLVGLSANVVRLRIKRRVTSGHADHPDLRRAIQAQNNAAEYMAMALLVVAATEGMRAPAYGVHALGVTLTAARIMHCAPFVFGATFRLRQVGTALTWTVLFLGGLGLIGWSLLGAPGR